MSRCQEATSVSDTREPHQPAPVVLPGKTMSHVAERMRLIRQGDHQEIACLEAALTKGKGLRPWRLTAENPDFFHPATLLRLIEDKRREKILKASGTSTTGANHQAPIANLGTKRTGERRRRSGGEGARVASPPSAEGFGGNPHARDSPGSSTASDYVESCSYGFGGMGGGEDRGAAGRGGDGVYSKGPSLDIEIDVRKRILELVGANVLDTLQVLFRRSEGRLGREDFIKALCVACGDEHAPKSCLTAKDRGKSKKNAREVSVHFSSSSCETSSTFRSVSEEWEPPCAAAAAAAASANANNGEPATRVSGSVNGQAGVPHRKAVPQRSSFASASPPGRWPEEACPCPAQEKLRPLYDRLFDFISLQHCDWTTWDELSNFLLFAGESTGPSGNPGNTQSYSPAGSVHLPKVLGLESAVVFRVSRGGHDADVAALLVRQSPFFMLATLDGLQMSATPARVKGHTGQVLAATFVAPFSVLVTSGEKDRTIRCWDVHLKPTVDAVANRRQAKALEPQIMLTWAHRSSGGDAFQSPSDGDSAGGFSGNLVSGGTGGAVNVWQLTVKHLVILHRLPGHTEAVTSACFIPHPELVVTGALDADIRVWDTKTLKCKRVLKGHSRGVVTIEYSPSQRIIVSAGFDHDILVWSPIAGQIICRLTGHGCSLVAARVSAISSDVISMSMDGIIKVWDSTNFKCVQTICTNVQQEARRSSVDAGWRGGGGKRDSLGDGGGGGGATGGDGDGSGGGSGGALRRGKVAGVAARKMRFGKIRQDAAGLADNGNGKASASGPSDLVLFEAESSRLLVCRGAEVDFYDNGHSGEKDVTDSIQTIDVMYHAQTGTFATVAASGVKLWDARTGKLTRAYGIPPRPAKTAGGRWKKRKGGAGGASANTGGGRRRFSRVVLLDGDTDTDSTTSRSTSRADEITSACVDASGRQIVIGFNTGRVACAQFLTGRLVGQLDSHRGEVTDLVGAWTDNSGALVLSTSDDTAYLQKMAVDITEPRRTIVVLDPVLEAVRMERFKQIVEGSFADADRAVRQMHVGAAMLSAKKTFLTSLEQFRDTTPTRAGATKTAAWRKTAEPVVTIDGETKTFGSDNGDQPSNGINTTKTTTTTTTTTTTATTTSSSGSHGTGATNRDSSSNSVVVYSVSSPRACRLIAPSSESDRNGYATSSSSNPAPPRSVGKGTAHDTTGGGGGRGGAVRFSASGGSDGARYGGTGVVVAGSGTTGIGSKTSMAVEGKGEELRPAQAVAMPTKKEVPMPYRRPHVPPERPPPSSALATVSGFHKRITRRIMRGAAGLHHQQQKQQQQQQDDDNHDEDGDDDDDDDDDDDGENVDDDGEVRDKRRLRERDRGRKGEGRARAGGGRGRGGEERGTRSGRGDNDGGGGKGGGTKKRSRCGKHITCVAVSHMYELAATGFLNGHVIVWDVQKGSSSCGLGILKAHNGYQVNSICFLEPHAALATCNLEGVVAVWRMGPDPTPTPAAPPRKDDNAKGEEEEEEEEESTREDEEGVGVDKKTNCFGASIRRRPFVPGAFGGAAEAVAAAAAKQTTAAGWRRKWVAGSMSPCSSWKCVALFVNNTTAFPTTHDIVGSGGGGGKVKDGSPGPSAVNSLAWSSVEERLFTGDTDGLVKVWDVKGAITCWGSAQDGESHSSAANGARVAATSDNNNSSRGRHGKDTSSRNANGRGWETRATSKNNNNHGSNKSLTKTTNEVDAGATTARDQRFNRTGPPTTERHPSPTKTSAVSAASGAPVTPPAATKFSGNSSTFDVTPASKIGGEREEAKVGVRENENVCRSSSDGKSGGQEAVVTPVASGDCSSATLWPAESGGHSQGGAFADRFGRGIGLQFVKLVGEWRPGREGRQEIIKVKVFEDQNVEFRTKAKAKAKKVADRARRDDDGDEKTAVPTQSGNVIVATITPDKLVRFWTCHGGALGSLDQEFVASPNHEIAARPLASWRMCVVGSGVGSKDQRVGGASDRSDDDDDYDDDADASTLPRGGSFSRRPAATTSEGASPLILE